MNLKKFRIFQLAMVVLTLSVLMASFYFEYAMGLIPCPLCLMQRFMVMILLATCMMAFFCGITRLGKYVAGFHQVFALLGLFFAGRQIWLQSLPPDQVPACMPGMDVLLRYFPWEDILHAMIWGAGDCAEVTWRFLGLTMAAWAAIYFICMFVVGVMNYLLISKELRPS